MSEAFARHEELVVDVAVILETQGFEVALEADVAGLQVDLLATKGRGRGRTRILVECKAFSRLVGLRTARSFDRDCGAFLLPVDQALERAFADFIASIGVV